VVALRLRTVDAFTEKPFSGNPAAVVVLDETPRDEWMAALAREMNLSETAYVTRERLPDADFRLRWFTPTVEVDLCGHATLAAAHCLFEDGVGGPIRFATRSGVLIVGRRTDGSLAMDFPASTLMPIDPPLELLEAVGMSVEWTGKSANGFLMAVVPDEQAVRRFVPDFAAIVRLDANALIVTAPSDPGRPYDFVSRVFGPRLGIDEDPVTGSAHVVLAPYWGERLGRNALTGFQASPRSGTVGVEPNGDRVLVSGHAVGVLDAVLNLETMGA